MNFLSEINNLCDHMLILVREGEIAAKDDSCLILYGIIKDNTYLIKKQIKDIYRSYKIKG